MLKTGVSKLPIESLFMYGTGKSFDAISKCTTPFSNEVELAVIKEDSLDHLGNACGGSLVCLVDGLCGDIVDALSAIGNEQVITTMQVEAKTESIFPHENVEFQDVQAVIDDTSSTTSSTTSSAMTSSTIVSTDTTGTTGTSYSTTLVPTDIHQKIFNPVDILFAVDAVTSNDGDSQDDNSLKSIIVAFQDCFTTVSCLVTGHQSDCTATIFSLMCREAYCAHGKVCGHKLAETTII